MQRRRRGWGIQCACNAGCAALLLPLQAACADFLASVSMRETRALIERAAPNLLMSRCSCVDNERLALCGTWRESGQLQFFQFDSFDDSSRAAEEQPQL